MKRRLKTKLSFLLMGFFILSYQLANLPPNEIQIVEASHSSTVILGGQAIGVSINVDGIMILGFSEFTSDDGKKSCPAGEAGLKEGDIIVSVNGENITSASQFSAVVDKCTNPRLVIEYIRDGNKFSTVINAKKSSEDSKYHLGLWARDGTTGLGTLTFIDPQTGYFGALGHGVTDTASGKLITVGKSNIYFASVNGVFKSTRSNPGELEGSFISSEIGDINSNTELGIFGKITDDSVTGTEIPVAERNEVKTGEATIYCCIDGNNVEGFLAEIIKIDVNSNTNKSMIVRVTDESLINRAGGIVQGMSGAPIVQNGKLVGAVTHVFVNDPTRGYAIFIENMLEEANKVK